jgi:hypothetical protein
MKSLAEVFFETLTESGDKTRVKLKSDGRMQITLSNAEAQRHRGVVRHRGELVPGVTQLSVGNGAHERRLLVTRVRKLDQPHPVTGNDTEVTAHPVGKVFASENPIAGYSSRRKPGETYVPQKRAVKSKVFHMQNHPQHGWIVGLGKNSGFGRDPNKYSSRTNVTAVTPKDANFTDFYKGKK